MARVTARLGIAELRALAESDLLHERQHLFIDAALAAVVRAPADRIAEVGGDARVVQLEDEASPDRSASPALQSPQGSSEGGGDHG